jgi:acyl-CoA synthetase (AMP-forming)/AMP-acid ligase II
LDFMVAFLACLKARIVAVPVFPPHPSRRDSLGMFGTICAACEARYALTNAEYSHAKKLVGLKDAFKLSKGKAAPWPELKWIVADDDVKKQSVPQTSQADAASAGPKSAASDDVAFLQFTSGSTSDPKGVMITYGNLAHNLTLITSELNASADTVVVSWLPQYHDMGLIGTTLYLVKLKMSRLENLPILTSPFLIRQARTWACCTAEGPGTT